jgi:UDP-N-acetylmuramoyl-tripeptide--D-alanyl-D-alanine ligase
LSGFRWTVDEVVRALGVEPSGAAAGVDAFTAVSTDTRSIPAGSLFVALQGASFDAHDFLAQAAKRGAAGLVVSRVPDDAPSIPRFVVDDTRAALGRLGRHLRRARAARVVAVAGSNGKTSTKDLLRAALSSRLRVHATEANLNNQVGVPLTLLAIPEDAQAAVVEVGTNVPGELGLLTRFVEPDAAIVTSIGEEHLEGLGSLAGVLEEELAILDGLREGGVALVAEDPPELVARARQRLGANRVRVAGFGEGVELRPDGGEAGIRFRADGSTDWRWRGVDVHVPLPGRHNVRNALLAPCSTTSWCRWRSTTSSSTSSASRRSGRRARW